jgi:hypothetical protein
MTYRVEINDCLMQFHRAHEALIESLGGSQHLTRTTMRGPLGHWQVMELNWKKKYNARPVNANGSWKWLDFDSEQHYTLFIMKWS